MNTSHEQENQVFNRIWKDVVKEKFHAPIQNPKGYVLGGQPGAGKSNLITRIQMENRENVLVINGDEFRKYHPRFNEIQAKYEKDAPKHTAEFAGKMTELVIAKALENKFNVVVEGTFRTTTTPLKTLSDMKQNGYCTAVYIITTEVQTSWNNTLERYEKMLAVGKPARYTDKAHHDKVVVELPKNADIVFQSGKADDFKVFFREKLIFDKVKTPEQLPSVVIIKGLYPNMA